MLSILKASAGSGKTFALTYEYIRLLLGYRDEKGDYRLNTRKRDRHRTILAITFTNKATDEMKRRIVHELAVLAGMEPDWDEKSPYLKDLITEFKCSESALKDAARNALRQLLFDFSYFHVSTIDAFFQTILRTFAREAELDGNYELDIDTESAIGFGVTDLFASLTAEPDSAEAKMMVRWISRYLLERLREGKSVALFNRGSKGFEDLLRLIAQLSNERFASEFDAMMEYLATDKLAGYRRGVSAEAKALREEVRRSCTAALSAMATYPLPKGNISSNLIKQISDCSQSGCDSGKRVSAASVVAGKPFYNKAAAPYFADGGMAPLYNAVMDACRAITELSPRITVLEHIAANLFIMGLLRGVYTRVERFRNENNTLLLSDTNALLRKIIGDDDAPFVYERVGVDFHHFLIDEFQDTSSLQWDILRPLVNESQAWDYDNLIIGDEKQCIYRFRSSDPTLLQSRVGQEVTAKVAVRGATPEENTNWRSSRTMVEFNNSLFSTIASAYGYEDIYANVAQNVSPKHSSHEGYVEINRIPAKEFNEQALGYMAAGIKRELEAGYRPCDIAVLTRFRKEAVEAIDYLLDFIASDEGLAARGIRIISDDSMTIDHSPAVKRVVSVLRSVSTGRRDVTEPEDGSDDSPVMRRTAQEFENLLARYEHYIGNSMSPSEALNRAVADCSEPLPGMPELEGIICENLPAMVERIAHFYFPDGRVTEGEQVYLMAFEDTVADFCATAPVADIQSFLRWWDSVGHTTKLSASADSNALRVMTIHKSKGLEFCCVHIPFADWSMVRFKDLEWFEPHPVRGVPDSVLPPLIPMLPTAVMRGTEYREEYEKRHREQMLDELNAMYVAFTRAIDELVVSIPVVAEKKKKTADDAADDAAELIFSTPKAGAMAWLALSRLGYDGDRICLGRMAESVSTEHDIKRTALLPDRTVDMPPYTVRLRDSLMQGTRIETLADREMGRRRGNILHDVLAGISVADDTARAVRRAVRCGLIPEADEARVTSLLRNAIAQVEDRGWFSGFKRELRERPIGNADPNNTTGTERPDRVVWNADGHLDVIDYKFGHTHRKAYIHQVRRYVDLYRKLGFTGVRGYVWYVEEGLIEEVPDK
ncbi:MAG: UvrD-helicase domain-containing protein [Muribaculaceae bacterium]|nr:UvrD-helicase domain-containing protein [Muribaculaceae bacterium]